MANKTSKINYDEIAEELEQELFETSIPNEPKTPEQIRAEALRAINAQDIPRVKSQDLVGKEFTIINAYGAIIDNKPIVCFVLRDKKSTFQVSKARNNFTETFLTYFSTFETEEEIIPLEGYTFFEDKTKKVSGNSPIYLKKL